ncbi:hypothetical protein ACWGKW_32065 [Streptomyces sp. NPDC054766]
MDTALLAEIMERAAGEGVAISLRVDVERLREGGKPWTLVLASAKFGELGAIRGDFQTLGAGIRFAIDEMRSLPGEWEWLDSCDL